MFRRLLDKITGRQAYYQTGIDEGRRIERHNQSLKRKNMDGVGEWEVVQCAEGYRIMEGTVAVMLLPYGMQIKLKSVNQMVEQHNRSVRRIKDAACNGKS